MYTVIVADDEQEIRRSLIRKVNWGEVGFQVIGEAENGAEALELVEKLEPDLLLTDIRMPFISGIELARQVREIRPATQIAFLSGYDDFSYAQQAIQYNIISYLLKPISSGELEKELLKMKEKIDMKFRAFASSSLRQEHIEKTEFLMPLLLDGFGSELSGEDYQELMKNAVSCGLIDGEEPEALNYAVMVTRIFDRSGKNCTGRASVNAVDSILRKYVKYCSIYLKGRVVSLLLATPRGFDKYLHILVDDICQSVERIMDMNSVIGVSRIVDKLTGCHECYLEAMSAAGDYNPAEDNVHFISDDERAENFGKESVQQIVDDIENLLRKGTEEEITDYLMNFFDRVVQHKISQFEADFILMLIVSTVYQVLYSVTGEEVVQKMQQRFPMYNTKLFGNIGDSKQFYVDICTTAREMIMEQRKKSSVMLCSRAIRIINEKYMDPDLSLVSVSTEISVSPNYLSALLKKDTGETFKELLTKRRIETAKELLLDTSLKVREIAARCGYNDQHYFSYCFKKYTGISPNSCRRNYEDNRQN